jgi:methyl-accepting chemotaxis protein
MEKMMNSERAPMKISTRLALGFGALLALGIGIAVYSAITMRSLSLDIEELSGNRMVKVGQFSDMLDNYNAIGRYARNVVISDDPAFRDGELKKIAELRAKNGALLAELDKSITLPKGRELFKTIMDNRGPYNAGIDRAIALALQGDQKAAGALLAGEVRALQDVVFTATDDSRDLQQDIANTLAKEGAAISRLGLILTALMTLAMAGIGTLVAWLLTRNLQRALGAEPAELSAAVARVADGDLSQALSPREGDSRSVLANVARMQAALNEVVSTVRSGSDSVATASAQIAQGNNDLSQRTEEQASSLEETAASMEELGSTVRQNADNAKQANQLAQGACDVAAKGGSVVSRVVDTMKEINDSSTKIVDIIGVIDGIAFQTNILALNAAVEAARAGDQGRGFAVVASEVRSLAQRSADAAKQIKTLIATSVERVEQGTQLVDEAGATMTEIVSAIKRVTDIMGEISSASVEQSAGVSQVGEAVSQMDQVTQQNAALVEESAAAAESLRVQADQLVQAVAIFKLAGSKAASPTRQAAAAPAHPARRAPEPRPAPKVLKSKRPASGANTGASGAVALAGAGADEWASF